MPYADPTIGFDDSILEIVEDDLRGEYARMARVLKSWLTILADVTDARRKAKLQLVRVKKAVELSLRASAKYTDKATEAEVESNVIVVSAGDELLEIEFVEDRVKAVVDSLLTKRSMLMSLGGLVRSSIDADKFTS